MNRTQKFVYAGCFIACLFIITGFVAVQAIRNRGDAGTIKHPNVAKPVEQPTTNTSDPAYVSPDTTPPDPSIDQSVDPSSDSVSQYYYYCWDTGDPSPHHIGHPVSGDHYCTDSELHDAGVDGY